MPNFETPKFGSTDYDVTYCTMDGVDLEMDIYDPKSGGPWPALIFIHGGGWTDGDKSGVVIDPISSGILMASINYRM